MEEQKKSAFQAGIVPGIILAVVLIVYSLVLFILDVDRQSKLVYISYVFMAGILFWAMVQHRDKNLNGFISFGQAFATGFFTLIVGGILSAIFTYIFVTVIDPGFAEEILINAEEQMLEQNPNMSDAEIENAMAITAMFTSPVMLTVWSFFFNLLFGTILSLIIAIFAKRENTSVG